MSHVRAPRPGLLLIASVGALLLTFGCSSTPAGDETSDSTENGPATLAGGAPDFPLPADPGATIKAAGLPELTPDTVKAVRYRAHLDIEIDGHAVTIPALIGRTKTGASPLFTEADLGADQSGSSGVVHVEAERVDPPPTFSVGQFFSEWGVTFDKNCVATYCNDADHQLLAFRNGELVPDPASIPFVDGDQIVIWYGPRGTNPKVPTSYSFPAKN